jgi:UDP-2,3-diacylglucosamine pyrophosphatase LpxH
MAARLSFRSLFLSDIHLGLRAARGEYLLDFLRHCDCETLYLVRDIVDIWNFRSGLWTA